MTRYQKILLVRFLGYLLFFTGVVSFVAILGPVTQAELSYRLDRVRRVNRTVPNVVSNTVPGSSTNGSTTNKTSFEDLKATGDVIIPKSTQFGIVIPKINANALVVPNVDPGNEAAYSQALAKGVAQAKGTNFPGQNGNIYLFSHSTDAPWNIVRYNAIFYLLRELEPGDQIIMFYNNKRYDYVVFDKNIVDPSDTSYLTNRYDKSVLTLQTCDPPGTLFRRLIVRAKLAGT